MYGRLVMRGGRQGQVLASTMPRTQNRAEKGSTLLRRRSLCPMHLGIVFIYETNAKITTSALVGWVREYSSG